MKNNNFLMGYTNFFIALYMDTGAQTRTGVAWPYSRGKIRFNPQKIATKGFSTDSGRFQYTF